MDFAIRSATLGDYRQLRDLYHELDLLHGEALPVVFRNPVRPLRRKEFLAKAIADSNCIMLVAESDGQIVGVIQAGIREAPDHPMFLPRRYVWMESLVVRREFQRCGVGQALMRSLESWAAEKGIAHVELNVWEFNDRAKTFYESLGYETASRRLWKGLE